MARLLVGKKLWLVSKYAGIPFQAGPFVVKSFKQFLPAGPTQSGKERPRSLVEVFTDSGQRVLAVADIWTKDPNKSNSPW